MKPVSVYRRASFCGYYIALALASLFCSLANAETRYIDDEIYVPLRSGPSSQNRILHKGLKTGLKLEFLGQSEDETWVQVRTPEGLEGWVRAQYLSTTPTARIVLKRVQGELGKTKDRLEALQKKLNDTQTINSKTKSLLDETERKKQQATMELHRIRSISSGAIELDEKYQNLLEKHKLLQIQNDQLNAENSSLKNDRRFSFMFYGAALVLLGVALAIVIPHIRAKKRHSEWVN